MAKRIYSDEERLERKRAASRNYYAKKRLDPEFKAKGAAATRAKYAINKQDPEYVKKVNAQNLKDYHEKVKPFADKLEKRRALVQRYQQKRRIRFQATKIQLQQLLGGKCVSCGLDDHRLLDFDHINPADKFMNISQNLHMTVEELTPEVMKCQLLCPNCHRIKTLESKDYDAYKNREFRNSFRSTFKSLVK